MAAIIEVPSALQRFVDNQATVEVPDGTVSEAIGDMVLRYAGLKEQLFDEEGRIRSFVNIYVNDEDIRYADNLDSKVKDGDIIQIVPSIAGGC